MFAFLLLCLPPLGEPTTDRVDVIQIENFYSPDGQPIFVQAIFWRHDNVQAWRLIKSLDQYPQRYGKGYRMRWLDGGTFRQVDAKQYVETFSQEDTELLQRDRLPKEEREGLTP